ncbi:putative membrane associated protein [Cryptosporidium canis]|uniref:Membrane associated protein n=1 Tax=Cryptosporidium canis TaxID=195482 RepID=A0ABQ8P873_9CRYT|nr:putative membrane associated protein [Cryptosporidium canis]KAJ1614651.1 putative membrane associated protein [Cryptosporidium canis]
MFTYSITGFNFRTEETPLTKNLKYALAFVLVLQLVVVLLRIATLTDTISIFFETWMIYLGYVVYTEKSPCALFIFISMSFVRGVLMLLTTIEWLKRNTIVLSEIALVKKLTIIIFIATPILSFLACIISYYIFKNLHVVEEVDEQFNQLLNPWSGLNATVLSGENTANTTNDAGNNDANTNINSASVPSRVIYTPFTGKSYKLSDISSSNSMNGQTGSYPIYKGT